jgi:hypothetical protein
MSTLFTDDDDGMVATAGRPDPKTVRLLEGFNYSREAVRQWTPEKAETVLRNCKREERIALARAAQTAKEQDGAVARGQPSQVERLQAAAFVEQALKGGVDEVIQAVGYALHVCTDDEARDEAMRLVRLWRGQA